MFEKESQADMIIHPADYRPRVVLVTDATSRISLPVLQRLMASERLDFRRVLFINSLMSPKLLRQRLRNAGWRVFLGKAMALVHRAARSKLRKWQGVSRRASFDSTKEYAIAHNASYQVVRDLNTPDVAELLKQEAADFLLVASCCQILSNRTLVAAKIAAVNIHPSVLPLHRGPYPTFWTLYNSDKETGVTFHLMHTGIDRGDILAQFVTSVDDDTDQDRLAGSLFDLAASRVESVLCDLAQGRIQPRRQSNSGASYEGAPTWRDRAHLARQVCARHQGTPSAGCHPSVIESDR